MQTTWASALAWRLRRHHLEPGSQVSSVEEVVERLIAVAAWSGDPELAVRSRLTQPSPDTLEQAIVQGRLIKVFAFRGATHVMTPQRAADHLALRAAGRMWERSSWRSHYALEPEDWPPLRAAVRQALSEGPLTPAELASTVSRQSRFSHLREPLSRLGTFLKPFFWQGDVCFGPAREGEPTLQALAENPRWPGIPDLHEAGRRAVTAYLGAYGPATAAHLHYWLGEGLGTGRRRIEGWLADLAGQLTAVDVEGEAAFLLAEHAGEVVSTPPSRSVLLLPGHDQWVLGPGTADRHVVPPDHRPEVTRGASLLVVGGVVRGTWRIQKGKVTTTLWGDVDLTEERVAQEVARSSAWSGERRSR